jgi:UDP-N-acetylglucosamine 2-epimerase
MKLLTVVGARPQFIKAAPVTKAVRRAGHSEILVHTGQHYDHGMSRVFFEELGIPPPDVNLGIGSGPHGWQTGQMLVGIEQVIQSERPDCVLVYGDTNSTLAGALAAVKLRIRVAHIEAGLRSFNREMPEEHNRVVADHCADLLFCPTQTAVTNLLREGITEGVHLVGDTMYDAVLQFAEVARQRSTIVHDLGLEPRRYLLATIHRPYNTDDEASLQSILSAFIETDEMIVFPVHPRTRRKIGALGFEPNGRLRLIDPVGYLDMLVLEQNARMILTDSGGVQKEAFFFGVPCLTLRPETEWVETVEAGWNVVCGASREHILEAARRVDWSHESPPRIFGDGLASEKITAILNEDIGRN